MRFLSVCSGIEAAGHAWIKRGWTPVAFSEVEKFACAVLRERYPAVPNLGDLTRFADWPRLDFDVLVGGTPCQAFSVAGRRESMNDVRGNLALAFCAVADRYDPEWIVWENVPGVFSTHDNAFGCFLGALCGEDTAIDAGRNGWTNAGVVAGPRRVVAWRVIDAQGFVAQRRCRIFVVSARAGSRLHPADVLFETEAEAIECFGERLYTGPLFSVGASVRRDHQTGGATAQDTSGPLGGSAQSGGFRTTDLDNHGAYIPVPKCDGVAEADTADRADVSAHRMTAFGKYESDDMASSMKSRDHKDATDLIVQAFTQNQRAEVRELDEVAGAFSSDEGVKQQTYVAITDGQDARTIGFNWQNGGGYGNANDGLAITEEGTGPLQRKQIPAVAVQPYVAPSFISQRRRVHDGTGIAPTISAEEGRGHGVPSIQTGMQVRRLTPTECERLMAMPDGYTLVPYNGKPAKDGPRYKALGNSMVTTVMGWIAERIDAAATDQV